MPGREPKIGHGHQPSGAPQPLPAEHPIILAVEAGDVDSVSLELTKDGSAVNQVSTAFSPLKLAFVFPD